MRPIEAEPSRVDSLLEHLRQIGIHVLGGEVPDEGEVTDKVMRAFLSRQMDEARQLAQESDLVEIRPLGPPPARRYVVHFRCRGLVRAGDGSIVEADRFDVGIRLPGDYLRRAEPFQVLAWLSPREVWHPNISNTAPIICIGRVTPGTPLVDLVFRCYDLITYQKVTMSEGDALNKEACAWARQNQHRFPIDTRPLKRRRVALEIDLPPQPGEAT